MSQKISLVIILSGLIFTTGCNKTFRLETESIRIELDKNGNLRGISDRANGRSYLSDAEVTSLLSIRSGGAIFKPSTQALKDSLILLDYPEAGITATVKVEEKDTYLVFELIEITSPDKVELVIWGPYNTNIKETIGETIGIVRDSIYAIGIQALNPRTLGGHPENEDDSFTEFDIFSTTSLVDIADSVKILYRGNTARPSSFGSSLSAYTRSRNHDQVVACLDHERYVVPAFNDEGIIGSKIAILGCRPEDVLDILESIEIKEGLPHPMLNGKWAKRAPEATSAYLIQDFSPDDYKRAIELTKKAGLKYLYHGEPFSTWGHFNLRYNMTWDDLRVIVTEAESQGIKVGVHTLSNFITTNDPYVTPVPDKRLAKVGTSSLAEKIGTNDKNIVIEDPAFFNQMKNNSLHAVLTGTELIRYEKVSETEPWTLINCERGAFGTTASSHEKGTPISKLIDHPYKTLLTNNELSEEVSARLAELFNTAGLKQISFDGIEGNGSTGMGKYGELLFAKNWYDRLKPEIKNDLIMDASRSGHFFWHMFTRMNWGEPWYAGFRESQTEYRLLNQDYFRRNYIPCMLGWFRLGTSTSIEDIEWMLARSAAFDAGYALVTRPDITDQNGCGEEILGKIKEWEKARISGSFNTAQKKRMENIKNEFSLIPVDENQWVLIPYEVKRFEHQYRELQPGQPQWTSFTFTNPYREQGTGFILSAKLFTASDIVIEIDDFNKTELNVELKPAEYLKYTGGNEIIHYSENWHIKGRIPVDPAKFRISTGDHDFKLSCRFSGTDGAALRMELKTSGDEERVGR